MSLFGRKTGPVSMPDVSMFPPGGGSFMAGAHCYQAMKGRTMKVLEVHVEDLEDQGWSRVNVAPPQAQEPQGYRVDPPRPLSAPGQRARCIAGPRSTNPITVEGRTYYSQGNIALDVPREDARILCANGWRSLSTHGSGPSWSRPINLPPGSTYCDDDLQVLVIFDGQQWRHGFTGAPV